MNSTNHPNYGYIDGHVVMIGYGSIGRGTLPLIERHFSFDRSKMVVIDPSDVHRSELESRGIRFVQAALTPENINELLRDAFPEKKGFCVNLSVDVGSLDVMKVCREIGVFYIDTVVEPWAGVFFDTSLSNAERTNYAFREEVREEKKRSPGGVTAVSCCGANPGMVSWFVKAAMLELSKEILGSGTSPQTREDWARLARDLDVKGIHIAERDTQFVEAGRPINTFVNTWSIDGFISEGLQPAELGWGTFEKEWPEGAKGHEVGCRSAIYLPTVGSTTRVHTWTPESGPQLGFLLTHNEAISLSDYFTLGDPGTPEYRPTCHYAYHPCDQAVISWSEVLGKGKVQDNYKLLSEDEIVGGEDCLGVLLYGHEKNAFWYGSRLSIEEARAAAPLQNATGLQVSSAVLAGMAWVLRNPRAGIVETEEMDHDFCLEVQAPYLGRIEGHYTDWTPLSSRWPQIEADLDHGDPWQFRNVIARG